MYPTPLAYFARHYTYWRGGINIKVEIASTNFHRGKLLASLVPVTIAAPTTVAEATNYPHFIIDLQERKSFTMKVPYDELVPYRRTKTVDSSAERSCYNFKLFVLNTLATTTAMATSVDVIFYVSAASDFELAMQNFIDTYELNQGNVWVVGQIPSNVLYAEEAVEHSGDILVEDSKPITIDSEPDKEVMVVEDRPVASGPLSTLEMPLEAIVKRPFLLCSTVGYDLAASSSIVRILTFPVTPTPMSGARGPTGNTKYNPLVDISSILPALACTHRFWRGSMKYRMVFTTSKMDRCVAYVVWTPGQPYGLGLSGNGSNREGNPWSYSEPATGNNVTRKTFERYIGNFPMMIQDLQTDPVLQFTVPWMSPSNRLMTAGIPPPSGSTKNDVAFYDKNFYNGYVSVYIKCDGGQVVSSTNQASVSCGVWVSGGDDFELSYYMGIPICGYFPGMDNSAYVWKSKEQYDAL